MILAPSSFIRVGLLLLLAVILQVSGASQTGLFGGHAVLLLLTDWRKVNRWYGPMTIDEEVATEASAILARGAEQEIVR